MTASRTDRLAERFSKRAATRLVNRADRRYWALYRTLDASQSDVGELVQSRVDTSQSTVSRVINDGDKRALVDEEFVDLGGKLDAESIREREYPDEWFEAYRDVLARAVTDKVALEIIADQHRPTPEWAARRYPELVGAHHHVARHWGTDEAEIADDSRLTRLDSVNTDRWK